MHKITLTISLVLCCIQFSISQEKKILFIGNSYTFIEDIPNIFYEAALSTGDILTVDTQTQGSATFEVHANNTAVTDKINSDNWDFVILQGQSVEVALTGNYFDTNVAPYAAELCQTIEDNDPCTQPVFYNTWGREFGLSGSTCDAYPWTCTYIGMDDALAQNYRTLADNNNAVISPVGQVWRYIRENTIEPELYNVDQSHQSLRGAYAAACTFYATILRKDPTLITYNPGISTTIAAVIRNAAKVVVYDQLATWKIDEFDPKADFNYFEDISGLNFINNSINAEEYSWDFGDSNTSIEENPIHTYDNNGDYNVALTVAKCGASHTYNTTVTISTLSVEDDSLNALKLVPNPFSSIIKFQGIAIETVKSIQLYNVLGKQLHLPFNTSETSFDLSTLASGSYFLKITTKNGSKEFRKVIKN